MWTNDPCWGAEILDFSTFVLLFPELPFLVLGLARAAKSARMALW